MASPRKNRRSVIALSGVAVLSLGLAACSSGSSTTATTSAAGGGADCAAYKAYGDLKGKTVTVYTSIVAPEDASHKESYKPFEQCTGATIKYEGSKEFEAQLPVRVKRGNAPDIAYIPQPGLLNTLVSTTGKVVKAPQLVSDNVDKYFGKDWKAYGTVGGTFYAAPLGANVKSFVWYSPKTFKAKGYTVPKTWDEMMALTDKIVADDSKAKPWCVGFGSGDATGWPGTDWLEDVMLRTAGPEKYDAWVAHKIPFNDPSVVSALAKVGSIVKNPKYVGDVKAIATTTFQDAGLPIVTDGSCYMHRQASFYAANWPKGTKVAEDGDVWAFYLPAIDAAAGKPVLGGGEFVAAFADRPEVAAFQAFLASPEWANAKAKATTGGGWVSANKELKIDNLTSPMDKLSAGILQDPKAVFRFDGSDLMPGAVGAGSFWKEMTNWVASDKSDADVLNAIEASWK